MPHTVRKLGITLASLVLLSGCGAPDTGNLVNSMGVSTQPSNGLGNTSESTASSGSMKLVSKTPVFGGTTFDPENKFDGSVEGFTETNGYVAILWLNSSDGYEYMSVAKNQKWLLTDKRISLPLVPVDGAGARSVLWGSKFYFLGQEIYSSQINFQDGTVAPPKFVATPGGQSPFLYEHNSPTGPVFLLKESDGQWHALRVTDGKDVVVNDPHHRLWAGSATLLYFDLQHHLVFIAGQKGQSSVLHIQTGEPEGDQNGQLVSPAFGGSLIGDGTNLYSIPLIGPSSAHYTIQKFDNSLQPDGTLLVPVAPKYNFKFDTTQLTLVGPYLHIWRVYESNGHAVLAQITVSR